ncbi:MAG: hypothetical protein INR66_04315 [Gordonia polyisoprenivorans]|nr:hypothetical protein [Gordonia polyisoprenivorans]
METCTAEFERLATTLGGVRCDGNPFITLTNPFDLANWTLPLIELLLVAGAAAGLVHAIRWRRRTGDPSNLIVWIASVLCLLLIEPIAYFPQWFGLENALGLTFAHNQFTVQFLYNRMPLYIVAMYPVFGYLSYVLIQRTGILRSNPVIAATTVAFTFHCFYEIVDTVGPQWRWWVWNADLATSKPALGSIPLVNLQAFSLGIPFAIALVTILLTRRRANVGVPLGVLGVCVLVWPVMFLTSAPSFVLDLAGMSTQSARSWATWGLVVVAGVVTVAALAANLRRGIPGDLPRDRFPLVASVVYLVASAVFWGAAIPDYLDARGGFTPDGAPIGSLPYAIVTFALSIALLVATHLDRAPASSDVAAPLDSQTSDRTEKGLVS